METIEKLTKEEALNRGQELSRVNQDITFYVKKSPSGYFVDASHYHLPSERVIAGYTNGMKTTWP